MGFEARLGSRTVVCNPGGFGTGPKMDWSKLDWPKLVLTKIGQIRMSKTVAKVGPFRYAKVVTALGQNRFRPMPLKANLV